MGGGGDRAAREWVGGGRRGSKRGGQGMGGGTVEGGAASVTRDASPRTAHYR